MKLARIIAVAFLALIAADASAAPARYNVLFIAVDDMRPELACYGHPIVKSPCIDRLAAQGLQFDRAYCQFALCNPTRSSLLTGRRPETIRVYDLATFLRDKNPGLVTLPQHFKGNGFQTLSFGKIFHTGNGNHEDPASWSVRAWHSPQDDAVAADKTKKASKPSKKKKSDADPDSDPHADEHPAGSPDVADNQLIDGQIADRAIQALRQMSNAPFFMGVGFHRPHMPFIAPRKYWDLYDRAKISVAPNPFLPTNAPAFASNEASELRRYKGVPKKGPIPDELARELIHGYYASISYVDAQIGRVLDELDRLGLRQKTVVILWGDHGYQLGEHGTWNKRTNWEVATRVPMIIAVPGQAAVGKKTKALVEFVDIFPTLSELCQLPLPKGLEGTSFVPLLENPNRPWKTAVFSCYTKSVPGFGHVFGRAMRTEQYRFVEWCGSEKKAPVYELYDHKSDPSENSNIANQPENKELVKTLSEQLHKGWQGAVPSR